MYSAAGKFARVTAVAFAVGLSMSTPGLAQADTDTDDIAGTGSISANHPGRQDADSRRRDARHANASHANASRAFRTAQPTSRAAASTSDLMAVTPRAEAWPRQGRPISSRLQSAMRTAAVNPSTPTIGDDAESTRVPANRINPGRQSTVPPASAFEVATASPTAPAVGEVAMPVSADTTEVPAIPALAATAAATTATADWFSGLLAPVQSFIEGIALLVRRTFFNEAPTVAPVQTTGQFSGPITGTVGATDPEGDPLTYAVTVAPRFGSVEVSGAGDYVYTPGADFTGLDSFNIAVTDAGFHLNLLDPSRPASTEAFLQVAQNATLPMLTFSFVYGSGSQYWSSAARGALQDAAMILATYLVVDAPTTIVYDVTAENSPSSSTLASAGSDLTAPGAGFFSTVVQQKIQSGIDANGSAADGDITFNFGNPWAFGGSVSRNQYDFTSTAMHELLHTFGFLSYTEGPGSNSGRSWTTFDQFIVTADGTSVITDSYRWPNVYNINLTGGADGLYFGGPNAVAAYGGPVPLYTPSPWESGSSMSHLDDDTFTGADAMLMNAISDTGLGIRILSPTELGILKDLGYTVFESGSLQATFVLIGFGFLRRRTGAQRPVN